MKMEYVIRELPAINSRSNRTRFNLKEIQMPADSANNEHHKLTSNEYCS